MAKSHLGSSWRFTRGGAFVDVPVAGSLRSDTGPVLLSAALAGLGLVVVQEYMARTALREGGLRTALGDFEVSPTTEADTALYAVYPHSKGMSPNARVRRFPDGPVPQPGHVELIGLTSGPGRATEAVAWPHADRRCCRHRDRRA